MDISPKLTQYRYHLGIAVLASLVLSSLLYVAPRFLTVLQYFWPLLASTAVFLLLVVAFGGVSQLATDAHGEKAGEGLLDYVAGQPQRYE